MNLMERDMQELRRQLEQGSIQRAYRALLSYMMGLRTHFVSKYGEPAVSGLYQGYMDMTYFALLPPSLKRRDLKIAIVFNYQAFRFEGWLAARNRKLQRDYWEVLRAGHWADYRLVSPAGGVDSIVECDLVRDFDLTDPEALTERIDSAAAVFIGKMEEFLSQHHPLQSNSAA